MRKTLLLLFIAFSLVSSSQTKVGLRGGVNLSTISFKDYNPETKLLTRFNLGTMIEFPVDDDWSIYTGPYYSGKGTRIDSALIRLNYIELPLQLGYKFSADPDKQPAFAVGGYLSYGFNGNIQRRGASHPSTIHLHRKLTDQYKRMDFGLMASFLYEIKGQYGIRIDYSRSLFNLHRVDNLRNQVFGISLFALFRSKEN